MQVCVRCACSSSCRSLFSFSSKSYQIQLGGKVVRLSLTLFLSLYTHISLLFHYKTKLPKLNSIWVEQSELIVEIAICKVVDSCSYTIKSATRSFLVYKQHLSIFIRLQLMQWTETEVINNFKIVCKTWFQA